MHIDEHNASNLCDTKTTIINGSENSAADSAEALNKNTASQGYQFLADGKRHLYCNDLSEAEKCLSEACRILGSVFGDLAVECAEAYYYYGVGLLELSRSEANVVGGAENSGTAVSDDDDDDEEEDGVADDGDASAQDTADRAVHAALENNLADTAADLDRLCASRLADSSTAITGANTTMKDPQSNIAISESGPDGVSCTASTDVAVEVDEVASDGAGVAPDDPDAMTTEQLAWEVLDTARVIYEKQTGTDAQLRVADCRLKLGELSVLDDDVEKAMEDFTACLDIQRSLLKPDDRRIAETYYSMGLALQTNNLFAEAAEWYQKAFDSMTLRKGCLNSALSGTQDATAIQKELSELDSLLPELRDKIDDCVQSAATVKEHRSEIAEAMPAQSPKKANPFQVAGDGAGTSCSFPGGAGGPKGTDITHLVRRPMKRSLEADGTADIASAGAKKTKDE